MEARILQQRPVGPLDDLLRCPRVYLQDLVEVFFPRGTHCRLLPAPAIP